jgi:serine/threonine protein kinase
MSNKEDTIVKYGSIHSAFPNNIASKMDTTIDLKIKLGKGAYGEVWIGNYSVKLGDKLVASNKDVAIKTINLKYDRQLVSIINELKILDRLSQKKNADKYIATMLDYFIMQDEKDEFVLYIAMEILEPDWLPKFIEESNKLTGEHFYSQFKTICKDLLEALRFIHDNNVVHGDIKLENILYNPNTKRYVFSDFGLSCFRTTCSKALRGTVRYMDPSLLLVHKKAMSISKGKLAVAPSTDIYSLGCVLYHLVIGNYYFDFKQAPDYSITTYLNLFSRQSKLIQSKLYTKKITDKQVNTIYNIITGMIEPFKMNGYPEEYIAML